MVHYITVQHYKKLCGTKRYVTEWALHTALQNGTLRTTLILMHDVSKKTELHQPINGFLGRFLSPNLTLDMVRLTQQNSANHIQSLVRSG